MERKPTRLSEVWQQYVKDILQNHPGYTIKNKPGCVKNYYIMKGAKEVTNFNRFNTGIQQFMFHAGDIMIETGGVVVLPKVGKIILSRIQNHPLSRQIDFEKTMSGEPREDGTYPAVYKNNPDWIKVNFISDLTTSYEFVASKPSKKPIENSMVGRLCNMLKKNKLSKWKYEYEVLGNDKVKRKFVKDK